MISYIGYKSQEIELYISEFEITDDEEDTESSFSSKLGIDDEDDAEEVDEEVSRNLFINLLRIIFIINS